MPDSMAKTKSFPVELKDLPVRFLVGQIQVMRSVVKLFGCHERQFVAVAAGYNGGEIELLKSEVYIWIQCHDGTKIEGRLTIP